MKLHHLVLLLFHTFALSILSFDASADVPQKPEKITLGFIPSEPDKKLRQNALELGKLLQRRLGVKVEIFIPKDYQGLIDKMKSNEVDFAFFTAMSFVFAEKSTPIKVLLKKVWNKNPYYYSTILTHADRGIESIDGLKGKKFGFVDNRSTSGYLAPKVMFKKRGIETSTYFSEELYTGNHSKSIEWLVSGKADGVAVFSDESNGSRSAWDQYFPKSASKAKVLWVSEPIPSDPLVVRESFYTQFPILSHDVMFALLELDEIGKGALLKKLLGVEELIFATSKQYDPVRDLVKYLDLKMNGN